MAGAPQTASASMARYVAVNGAAGELCQIQVEEGWTTWNLKEAISQARGLEPLEQRLICGLRELKDTEALELLASEHPEVTLVRRSEQQVKWLRIAEEDWSELLNEAAEAWEDKSVVLAAVSSCGWALRYASEELKNDQDVALAAVQQNGLALQFASPALRAQRALALAAVAQCGRAFAFAAEELRRERSFVLAAAGRNGHVLKYVEEALQDEEVVQQAIEQCGSALSDVLGDAFEESSRQKKIKHVLLDKGVLGSDLKPSRQMELEQIPNICFFGLDTDTSSAPGARGVQRALGPAGAGLLEMAALGLPVPRGFCLTDGAQWGEAKMALRQLEALHQHTSRGPLLLSLRNGQTEISNLGLTDEIALQLATENANCAWDSYRRLVVSYAKTVHRLSAEPFDAELSKLKDQLATKDHLGGRLEDWQLPTRELEKLVETYKLIFEDQTGEAFPQDPEVQFKKSLAALEGTVIVESMVFGNYDFDSGVGVLQLQEPGLNGAWLPKAQREDLPERPRRSLSKQHSQDWAKANAISESVRETEFLSLEEKFLPVCAGLAHCKDVLLKAHLQVDAVHFAVQQGRLWLLGPAPTSPARSVGVEMSFGTEVLAKNLLKFSGGFPFGALCCSLYVNFLHRSGEVNCLERLSCASAAVTLASVATYPLHTEKMPSVSKGAPFSPSSALVAVRQHGWKALRSANPVAAAELCTIDLARQIGQSCGAPSSYGLLFASGCAAGCFTQSVVHAHSALTQRSDTNRRERFQAFCRAAGPSFLKHAPAVGVNSLVRVGLVTHFMNQQ